MQLFPACQIKLKQNQESIRSATKAKPKLEFRERIYCPSDEKMHTFTHQETDFTGYIFFSLNMQRNFKCLLCEQF